MKVNVPRGFDDVSQQHTAARKTTQAGKNHCRKLYKSLDYWLWYFLNKQVKRFILFIHIYTIPWGLPKDNLDNLFIFMKGTRV